MFTLSTRAPRGAYVDFSRNHLIYYTFNRLIGFDAKAGQLQTQVVLARGRLEGLQLSDTKELLVGEIAHDFGGSRLLFGKDNLLYVSVGGLSKGDISSAQRTDNVYGKVLRIRDDGTIPADNPFVNVRGARAEIYSVGRAAADARGARHDDCFDLLTQPDHNP